MLALAIAITTGVITTIMMAADGIHGTAAGRVGLCRAVSISPIVTVRRTGTDKHCEGLPLGGLLFEKHLTRRSPITGTHKKDKRWAYGTIGTLVGFWLRQ